MRVALIGALAAAVLCLPAGRPAGADGSAEVSATVRVNPVSVTLSLDSSTIGVGRDVFALAIVDNAGASAVTDVSVTLRVQPDGISAAQGVTQLIGTIDGHGSSSAGWDLCGAQPGNYLLLASATATTGDGEIVTSESTARVLEVSGRGRKPCNKDYR